MNALEEFLSEEGVNREDVVGVVFAKGPDIKFKRGAGVPEMVRLGDWPARQGEVLTLDEALPLCEGWSFIGGHGTSECPPTNIWTHDRVYFVDVYDGATSIQWVPRNPTAYMPTMPGGE